MGQTTESGVARTSQQVNAPTRGPAVHSAARSGPERPPGAMVDTAEVLPTAVPSFPSGSVPRRRKGRIITTRVQTRQVIAQTKFLDAFAVRGVVLHAAGVAGVSRHVVYQWLQNDPDFKAKYAQAQEDAMDLLELEARRRAEVGWQEEVYQMGNLAGYVRKYDGNLMALLLKGRRGDVFRDRVSSEIDARVRAESNPVNLSDRELEDRILAEAQAIAARRLTTGTGV